MTEKRDDHDSPNPPLVVGAPVPQPSLGECMAAHAYQGTLAAFLIDIGYYYDHAAPGDRDRGRER
jgi:hypothetical protein